MDKDEKIHVKGYDRNKPSKKKNSAIQDFADQARRTVEKQNRKTRGDIDNP
jgi:hypothetical protein